MKVPATSTRSLMPTLILFRYMLLLRTICAGTRNEVIEDRAVPDFRDGFKPVPASYYVTV